MEAEALESLRQAWLAAAEAKHREVLAHECALRRHLAAVAVHQEAGRDGPAGRAAELAVRAQLFLDQATKERDDLLRRARELSTAAQ